jgi:hypothetical protein
MQRTSSCNSGRDRAGVHSSTRSYVPLLIAALLGPGCLPSPHPGLPIFGRPHDYTAPVLSLDGQEIGTSSMCYHFEPLMQPDGTPSQHEVRVCWSCTIVFRRWMTGGGVLFEIADRNGCDWALGIHKATGTNDDPIAVADTASIPIDLAGRLGAPHWHLLCAGSDWGIRCGKAAAAGSR